MAVNVILFICEYVIFSLIWSNFGGHCQDFGYDGDEGPTNWGKKYAQCIGKHQSPIDIETRNVTPKIWPTLKFKHFDEPLDEIILENNGNTVLMKVLRSQNVPSINGGPLKGTYRFAQLHFHWGPNNTIGSENYINHHSFPLEMHLVMVNNIYKEFKEAVQFPDGLTVLSFLISVGHRENEKYKKFEDGLREVRALSSNKTLDNFVSLNHLTTLNRGRYFTYEGSLTTPPCSEVVTWIEFDTTIPLSENQINTFRSLFTRKGHLTHNYRPIQPINDRIIYYNGAITHFRENRLYIATTFFVAVLYLGDF